jgi:hypothetical protein
MAVATYPFNSRTRRAEFIHKLHTDFFVSATYKEVRRNLDWSTQEELEDAKRLIRENSEKADDYLNFFEMGCYLVETKQLEMQDLKALFGYYLTCMARPELRSHFKLDSMGFENLSKMLRALKQINKEMRWRSRHCLSTGRFIPTELLLK